MEEATYLTKFAREVVIIHRREAFRASPIMAKRALENPKIRVEWNTEVIDVLGDAFITGLRLRNRITGEERELEVGGLFLAIGHTPNTGLPARGVLELNEAGYVVPAHSVADPDLGGGDLCCWRCDG
jgi:thioredoxin reductase (NADPH)